MTPKKHEIAKWILSGRKRKDLSEQERWAYDLMQWPLPSQEYEFTHENAIVIISALSMMKHYCHLFYVPEIESWAFQPGISQTTVYHKNIPDAVLAGIAQLMGIEGE